MFWKWNAEYEFMETQPGQHESMRNLVNQRLAMMTFCGDYIGSSMERYNFEYLVDNAPDAVSMFLGPHGSKLLMLSSDFSAAPKDQQRLVMEFVCWALNDPDYPLYDDLDYNDWEQEVFDREVFGDGDFAQWFWRDVEDWLVKARRGDVEIPEDFGERGELLGEYVHAEDAFPDTYWEGATTIIVDGLDHREFGQWLIDRADGKHQQHQETRLF